MAFDGAPAPIPRWPPRVKELASAKVVQALSIHEKQARAKAMEAVFEEVRRGGGRRRGRSAQGARTYFEKVEKAEVRRLIVEKGIRVDGRSVKEIRPISSEVEYLPRAHGSALFTRGETQALVAATLGTKNDEQKIESFEGDAYRRFMLHYNFPPFSTGEVKRFGTASRRDIGHGALAHRAVEAVLPTKDEFPYTIRIVSDILESNGSSSMATVCGASMALMDAGVAAQGAGRRHRHGPGQGRRQGRHPHRHHGDRGPLRRHGLQGRRHREGHHRAADGHQDQGRVHRHHAPGARAGARGAAARAREDGRDHQGAPGRASRPTRRASSPSRSGRRRSARSSAPAARSSAASRRRPAPRSTWRTTAR